MHVLVTGGCGFIGSHQVAYLLEAGHEVCVVDDLSNSSADVLDRIETVTGRRPVFERLNVLDTQALRAAIRAHTPSAIIHLAGYKHVSESTDHVVDYYENNVGGLLSLLRACEPTNMRRLVFSSSGSVYGETNRLPIKEDHPHNPTNPYASTKSICERILSDLCASDPSWAVIALRYFNPAGAHPSGQLGENPLGQPTNLVPALTRAATGAHPTAHVYGTSYDTEDGSGVRDYIHVVDVVETHARALNEALDKPGFRALNVGRGEGCSVFEVITAVEQASGAKLDVSKRQPRPGDVSALYGDTTAAERVLGLTRYRDLDEICADEWRWQTTIASETNSRGRTPLAASATAHRGAGIAVALAHEWIESRSGSEILFEQLARAFPDADLFALTSSPEPTLDLGGREVRTTFLNAMPNGRTIRAFQLPLMPYAWRRLERESYDLVLTSTHAFGREFATEGDGVHCNYVHAPMRYVWTPELDTRASVLGAGGHLLRSLVRRRDRASTKGVTSFAANSRAVAERIELYYEREATVIHPPVDVDYFGAAKPRDRGYLLAASRWIPYKRLDLAIDVAARLDLPLVLAGWGPLEAKLRSYADQVHPHGVEIRVRPSRPEMRTLMAEASAFLFPAHEDFGIIAAEAQAAGTPVVGLAEGGSRDTVLDGLTGTLAEEQTVESLVEATEHCLLKQLTAADCRAHAQKFSPDRFRREIRAWTDEALSR